MLRGSGSTTNTAAWGGNRSASRSGSTPVRMPGMVILPPSLWGQPTTASALIDGMDDCPNHLVVPFESASLSVGAPSRPVASTTPSGTTALSTSRARSTSRLRSASMLRWYVAERVMVTSVVPADAACVEDSPERRNAPRPSRVHDRRIRRPASIRSQARFRHPALLAHFPFLCSEPRASARAVFRRLPRYECRWIRHTKSGNALVLHDARSDEWR